MTSAGWSKQAREKRCREKLNFFEAVGVPRRREDLLDDELRRRKGGEAKENGCGNPGCGFRSREK